MVLRKLVSFRRLKSLYEESPTWVKSAYATIPFSLRMGRVFRETMRRIHETDFAGREDLDQMQGELLSGLVQQAYEFAPYYREVMDQARLHPGDIREVSDLHKMPLISKDMMRARIGDFVAAGGLREQTFWDNTGGSTGTPFEFLHPNSSYPVETAYLLAQWERVGYSPRERRLTLRGRVVGSKDADEKWQYNPIYNELRVSSYHIDADTIARLLPELKKFRPRFLYGYPSAIVLFLRTMVDNGMELPVKIKGVLCGSEPFFDYQRTLIDETLGCRAYSWYGQSERVLLAGECEQSTSYHSFPLYGIAELIDDYGNPITAPGVEGEIVGTSLTNLAMPFIRYRTNDRGVFDSFETCVCGRSHRRIKSITGRSQDYVYTQNSRAIPVTAIVFGQHFGAFARMYGMQLYQDTPGEVIIRVVRSPEYTQNDEQEVREKMETAVDREICIHFEYHEKLPSVASGKTPFVIQKVDPDDLSPHSSSQP